MAAPAVEGRGHARRAEVGGYSPRRALVRLPNWLGDTVMVVPMLRELRAAWPGSEVWGAGPWAETILGGQGLVDRIVPAGRGWAGRFRAARALTGHRFDLGIAVPNSLDAALWIRVAGARRRIGYRTGGRGLLLTDPLDPPLRAVHEVAAYLGLLRPLGVSTPDPPPAPLLRVAAAGRRAARRLLADAGVGDEVRPVGIQLGAGLGPSKLWPPARLAELAGRLAGAEVPVVFLGTAGAEPLLSAVAAALGARPASLVGRDSPALLAPLLAELAALVSADSGPAHVAAAVGTPVVTLFGPTDPRRSAPLGPRAHALWRRPPCSPCFRGRCPIDHRCLTAIGPGDVVAALAAQRVVR